MSEHPPSEVRGPGLGIVRRYASEAEAYRDLWAPKLESVHTRVLTEERSGLR
jgi:hypothetical protein